MMVLKMKTFLQIILFGITISSVAFAQSARSLINEGVDLYHKGKAADAEVNFKKGLEKEKNNYAAKFNLGDAYYKQERYDEAIKSYQSALAESKTNKQKAEIYHNIGNTFLKNKKLDESIEAYKQALKLNPSDTETKYNLSYALKQKNDQKNQNKDQDKDKDKNKDKNDKDKKDNKDQQDKQDKDKDKKKDDKQNQDQQNKDKKDNKDQQKQPQPQKNQISKADAERILNALKNNEKDLQKKLRKKTGKIVKTEKDW